MYETILVTLDATSTDGVIIDTSRNWQGDEPAALCCSTWADGWAARTFGPDAISPEIVEDQAYLAQVKSELESEGIPTIAKWRTENRRRRLSNGWRRRSAIWWR